jgi:type II secretory pathway component GspD/PulD (secretin)
MKILVLFSMILLSISVKGNELFTFSTQFNSDNKETHIIQLNHIKSEEILPIINEEFPEITIYNKNNQSEIILFGDKEHLQTLDTLIQTLDTPTPLVHLEISIYEIAFETTNEMDIFYSSIHPDLSSTQINSKKSLLSTADLFNKLQLLETEGNATLFAKPSLRILNNKTAYLHIGDQLPYIQSMTRSTTSISKINTGISFQATPFKTKEESVYLDLELTISSVKIWKNFGIYEIPVLSNREYKTSIIISKNETLIISGLTQITKRKNKKTHPILSKVPVIGSIFTAKKKASTNTDILILIKAK